MARGHSFVEDVLGWWFECVTDDAWYAQRRRRLKFLSPHLPYHVLTHNITLTSQTPPWRNGYQPCRSTPVSTKAANQHLHEGSLRVLIQFLNAPTFRYPEPLIPLCLFHLTVEREDVLREHNRNAVFVVNLSSIDKFNRRRTLSE